MDELTYLRHFHAMVLDGVAQGLKDPREWLCAYERGIGVPYENMQEVYAAVDKAIQELFDCFYCGQIHSNQENINKWFNDLYDHRSNEHES